ncbi:MAG: hypothetical protein GFH27_549309n118 [Chloroflexi bacterium AL-W]|nr:hypothetical protein [Chloroflexi bacterium AL-N1]NOK69820.1 hypothetical protein [Chloroflexi bacterium AL-N10]NOK73576.1 hypothetical protein [Chloroflexi bacterium AL-N5]NOK83990.1 hypothetical protein [Chloroflexi bacterium AL-W]NOK87907.1 hypothetical protein [Chloroflexi bacterium AL-N15]
MYIKQVMGIVSIIVFALFGGFSNGYTDTSEPDVAAIDAYIESEMQRDRIPGVALALVHDDQIVHVRGYGDDGRGNPIDSDTSFILGSMSKSFTALAIMQLVERGLIELDAPVQTYLPWFQVADSDASATITVEHLLHHTSGIPTRAPHATGPSVTLQDHVRALADVSLNNPPGTQHEYASPNYLVLGALIEEVSELSYAEYIQDSIFTPLDMRHSFGDQDQALRAGMSSGHRYWFGFPVPATLDYEDDRLPTAAVISSANDLSHYLIAQLKGGSYHEQTVLSSTGVEQMHAPGPSGDGFSYAFGWRVSTLDGTPMIHHGGIVPHFRGKMVFLPEERWGVAVLTNASTSLPLPVIPSSHRMADTIAGSLVGEPLTTSGYNQSIVYLLISVGLALILLSQARGLIALKNWWAKLRDRPHTKVSIEIASDLFWPLLVAIILPQILGLSWNEIWQGSPDLCVWLVMSAVLDITKGFIKTNMFRQYLQQVSR